MARGAGYRQVHTIHDLEDFRRRFPGFLQSDGPIFLELITGLSEQTPMTVRGAGVPFPQQVEKLHAKFTASKA